jgi:transposase-like protein
MSKKPLTITQFFRQFPDDETCLTHLFETRFGQGYPCPSCERPANWYRIKAERAYSCQWCGHHLHPTVGTPFEQTRTPLQLWFYAIHLFTTTRNGVAAKELERQLGVTYKTAWRMAGLIREHMANVDGETLLGGPEQVVQIDETMVGGKARAPHWRSNKTVVLGMVERGGELITRVVDGNRKHHLLPQIQAHIRPGTEIHSDESSSYRTLHTLGYAHKQVNHSKGQYVSPDGCTVNAIEGFWSQLKRMINGTHIHVSGKHLWKYAKEAEFRFNLRNRPDAMFPALISNFAPLN